MPAWGCVFPRGAPVIQIDSFVCLQLIPTSFENKGFKTKFSMTAATNTSTITISKLRLRLGQPLRAGQAPALRGFFGNQFEDQVYMHNHQPDGEPIYQYPRVQYKVLAGDAILLGVNEGSQLLQKLWLDIDQTKIGSKKLYVLESSLQTETSEIEYLPEPIEYQFKTPWIALNQRNFTQYTKTQNQKIRREKLEKTIVGNTLGMCKSLDLPRFTPDQYITADCSHLTSIKTTLKGKGMIGFIGKFTINLHLPNHLGLGKSTSRGFGTIERS